MLEISRGKANDDPRDHAHDELEKMQQLQQQTKGVTINHKKELESVERGHAHCHSPSHTGAAPLSQGSWGAAARAHSSAPCCIPKCTPTLGKCNKQAGGWGATGECFMWVVAGQRDSHKACDCVQPCPPHSSCDCAPTPIRSVSFSSSKLTMNSLAACLQKERIQNHPPRGPNCQQQ